MADRAALRAIISGRVQGVMYRAFAARRATELGLTGYVRNLPDGTVEVVGEGPRQELTALLETLKRGPPFGVVEKVDTAWSDYTGRYADFQIRY